jgi:hypothetical protein
MNSFEPPSSVLGGSDRFRTMPQAVPIRIAANEAMNAIVELMGSSFCVSACSARAGLFHFPGFANPQAGLGAREALYACFSLR